MTQISGKFVRLVLDVLRLNKASVWFVRRSLKGSITITQMTPVLGKFVGLAVAISKLNLASVPFAKRGLRGLISITQMTPISEKFVGFVVIVLRTNSSNQTDNIWHKYTVLALTKAVYFKTRLKAYQ